MIEKLDNNKATGLDGISPKILKLWKDFISKPISVIINSCISTGIFPVNLKKASVKPLFKGGDKSDPNNYRPISVLPTISKIFERHIANQLKSFLKTTDVLFAYQSGFRENHSCQTSLIRLIDSWLMDMDDDKIIGSVFLDFKKAFDLVDHEILLYKLKLNHFTDKACELFNSYLNGRFQVIKNGPMVSEMQPLSSGVPQGSILGPILFLLYVNDLPLNLQSNIDMYADDATLYKSSKSLSEINELLQNDLSKIDTWSKNNNMILNPKKTTCMVIGSKKRLKNIPELQLKVLNNKIENVSVQRVLGLYIDNSLCWKTNVLQGLFEGIIKSAFTQENK